MSIKPAKVGIIGCGNISGIYFAAKKKFEAIDIVACADLDLERAKAKAAEHGIRACTVKELLADEAIEIVINLTIPKAHAEVNLAAIAAGKNVHTEKPLAVTRKDGKKTLDAAAKKGVRVGSAPDTFLGGGIQTCIKLIDDGWIGRPLAATAFMMCAGHESWHPDPEFYYEVGGGPMFDMGPYYLTALVAMLGPVSRVTGSAQIGMKERTITSAKKNGKKIAVEVPTHVAGVLDFAGGAVGTIITSFEVKAHRLPYIEVYGTEGSLRVPDPNCFGGPVELFRPEGHPVYLGGNNKVSCNAAPRQWMPVELTHGYADNTRGIGVADMAYALRSGRKHRASGELAYHVLDLMQAFHEASSSGKHVEVSSTCQRPAPLPVGLEPGKLDA